MTSNFQQECQTVIKMALSISKLMTKIINKADRVSDFRYFVCSLFSKATF